MFSKSNKATFGIDNKIRTFLILLAIISLFFYNSVLIIYSLLTLGLILYLTWPKGHFPVLTVCLLFQWLQAITKILQASYENQSVNQYAGSEFAEQAILLTLTGIITIAFGFYFVIKRKIHSYKNLNLDEYNEKKIFKLFLVLFAIGNLITSIIVFIPALQQIILSISYLQWVGYALLFIVCLRKQRGYKYLVIAFGLELTINLFSYFSNFREVILFTVILYLPFIKKITPFKVFSYSLVLYFIYLFFIAWSGVKGEFRQVLSENQDISFTERANSFYNLYSEFDDYQKAEEQGLDRLAYVDMFMYCMETVPNTIQHENGSLWLGAIQHILMPRFLFPNKKAINDSEKANLYTGRNWAGPEQGTSISIGYIAESYVDFGVILMFAPLLAIGLVLGLIYSIILRLDAPNILPFAIASTIIFFTKFSLLEISGDKLLGAIVMNFVVIYSIAYFFRNKIHKYLY